ncbi:MAG: phosphodiester glycosidase family protein [Eubacteriales bacterium]|nr:phosphodiester glycosidase family protein [Eubacteriales bacterium]
MKIEDKESVQLSNEELGKQERKRLKKSKRRTTARAVDRIVGFLVATVIMFGIAGLGVEYVFVKGPSPALKEFFCMTFLETRRFRWIPNIFMSADEVKELQSLQRQKIDTVFDPSLITIKAKDAEVEEETSDGPQLNEYGDYDEDGDGIILEKVTGNGYIGYMIKVLDPKRVFVSRGTMALPLAEQCMENNALGGINAGAFLDNNGGGDGNTPEGLTIINGQVINYGYDVNMIAGLTEDGLLIVGEYGAGQAQELGIVSCVSFGPVLVSNGAPVDISWIPSGLNPRTAIGQRSDGCILMLVIDGRQVHSYGATYRDVQDVMLEYGAVNAMNLDGGSSTTMWYNGAYVNSCSSANGIARPIPDAFLFR